MSAVKHPYSKATNYWCKVCGNEWHEGHIGYGECWVRCEGCSKYVEFNRKRYYFEDTEDEGAYCNRCYEEKLEEREVPNVKESDC